MSTHLSVPVGRAAGLGQRASTTARAAAIRSTCKSNIGEKVAGGIAGLDVPAWDISCFYFHDAPVQVERRGQPGAAARRSAHQARRNNVRYFPSTLPHVRTDDLHLLDIGLSKNFALPRGMRLQLRLEAINALNYTVLWNPQHEPDATRPSGSDHHGPQQPARHPDRAAVHVLSDAAAPGEERRIYNWQDQS